MEKVASIMTSNPACCTPESKLTEISQMMIEYDCGMIPVVDNLTEFRLIGVVTDRDIVCRSLGKGLDPFLMIASDVMTYPVVSANLDTSIQQCCELMEDNHVRRIPVTDDYDKVCGIISLADIVAKKENFIVDVVKEVSTPGLH